MADFLTTFQSLDGFFKSATENVLSKIDQLTFKMLINCLKNPDYQVVVDALNQLEKEKRPISIPPIYFLAQAHPNQRIRLHSAKVLKTLDPDNVVTTIVGNKNPQEAVKALIEYYGNFRK